jgi:hypothetical protein
VKARRISWIGHVERMEDSMGIEGWKRKAQDRDQWRRIAQEAKADVGL